MGDVVAGMDGADVIAALDSYDWGEVFGFAGEPAYNGGTPKPVEGATCGAAAFMREDVEHVFDKSEGENDGPPWLIAGVLRDGRYFFIEAGCDYTGWDCRASGSSWVADSLAQLARFGLTDEARERLPGVHAALAGGAW